MLNSKSIGNKIAEARKKNSFSQAELAKHVSISPQAVGKWERGESLPDISTLNRLSGILGVDLNYFSDSFASTEPGTATREIQDEKKPGKSSEANWDMSQGNWVDADFSGLKNLKEKFSSSNMKNCKFRQADLSGLTLGKNNIESCDFSESDLGNSKIQFSNLQKNQFHKCTFMDSGFLKCNIEKCDFSEADFSGTKFNEVNFEDSNLKNSIWKFTSFKNTNLGNILFEGPIEDCLFERCSFYNVKFQNTTFRNTFFKYNQRFKKVEFVNCKADTLTYAFLKSNQANLEGITLLEEEPHKIGR